MCSLTNDVYCTLKFWTGTESLFFSHHLFSHLQPLLSSDWSSLTLIVHEHVLCWSVKGRKGVSEWCGEQQRSPQCRPVIDVQRMVQKPMTTSPYSQRHLNLSHIWKWYFHRYEIIITHSCVWMSLMWNEGPFLYLNKINKTHHWEILQSTLSL